MAIAGRLALITGGGSGIGRAVANVFAREGARVAVVDINAAGAEETAKGLDNAKAYSANIASSASVTTLLQSIKSDFSQTPCIAINAAGITRDTMMLKMKEEAWDEVMNVNLKGTFLVCQEFARLMVADQIKNGSIVNLSSISGKTGNVGQTNYSATKAGVIGLSKTIAKELAGKGIRCNAVLPGFIKTPMTETVPENVINMVNMITPLGRQGTPEEIAEACLFLASDKSSYVTGVALEVTGGLYM